MKNKTLGDIVDRRYDGNEDAFINSFYVNVVFGFNILSDLSVCNVKIDDSLKNICDKIDSVFDVDRRNKVDGVWLCGADRIRRNPFTVRRMRLLRRLYVELYDLLVSNSSYKEICLPYLMPSYEATGRGTISSVLYAIDEWLEWRSHRNWITFLWSRIWSRING